MDGCSEKDTFVVPVETTARVSLMSKVSRRSIESVTLQDPTQGGRWVSQLRSSASIGETDWSYLSGRNPFWCELHSGMYNSDTDRLSQSDMG